MSVFDNQPVLRIDETRQRAIAASTIKRIDSLEKAAATHKKMISAIKSVECNPAR